MLRLLLLLMLIGRVRLEVMGSGGLFKIRSITWGGGMKRILRELEMLVVDEILAGIAL